MTQSTGGTPQPGESRGVDAGRKWWALGLLALGGSIALGVAIAPASNAGSKDAAAVIAFATLIAVGIERALEICWTLVDNSQLGAYWPMSLIRKEITAAETATKSMLGPVLTSTKAALVAAKGVAGDGSAEALRLQRQIDRLDEAAGTATARIAVAAKLAPGSSRVATVSGAANTVATELRSSLGVLGSASDSTAALLDRAEIQLGGAIDVIGSFQDNPFRRLSSLMFGASIGVLITAFVGVNLFAAISDGGVSALQGVLGIIVTGLVVGLGSGPTHELVKSLQANKNSGQAQGVGLNALPRLGAVRQVAPDTDGMVEAFERQSSTHNIIRTDTGAIAIGLASEPMVVEEVVPPGPARRTVVIRSTT